MKTQVCLIIGKKEAHGKGKVHLLAFPEFQASGRKFTLF